MIRLLGQGTSGKVVEAVDAVDMVSQRRVAIKIIRAILKYRNASKVEVRVLQRLKERTPPTSSKHHIRLSAICILINVDSHYSKCIHLLDWFDRKNHICLVSELRGMCLYNFLKENDFQVFPRTHTRICTSIARECCV